MKAADVRVTPAWLDLREPVDAAARSTALVDTLFAHPTFLVQLDECGRDARQPTFLAQLGECGRDARQPTFLAQLDECGRPGGTIPALLDESCGEAHDGPLVVHDLGCGSGSMVRWLAPRLPGPQQWVLHDRDSDLLAVAEADSPPVAADGTAVRVETRLGDLTRLGPEGLRGASLVTASALLDMLTEEEVDRVVRSCVRAGCPALVTLSVTGRVRFEPTEDLDADLESAFNEHQRRTVDGRTLLGPDAAGTAARLFRDLGWRVEVAASPWRLDASHVALTREWLDGWAGAAVEQRPELTQEAEPWLARRTGDIGTRLVVMVQHVDLLALPASHDR